MSAHICAGVDFETITLAKEHDESSSDIQIVNVYISASWIYFFQTLSIY